MKTRKLICISILLLAIAMCFLATGCTQENEPEDSTPGTESSAFDIDGDGISEECAIESVKNSVAAYLLHVTDSETEETETFYLQLHEYSTLLFKANKDGHVYLYGETPDNSPKTHKLEVSITNGVLTITENGKTVNWNNP